MIVEKLNSDSRERLEIIYELQYRPFGYFQAGVISKNWSWRNLRFIYSMNVRKDDPKVKVEFIDNKSEINSKKKIFSYMDMNGNLFKKEFYINPNDKSYDQIKELNLWRENIKN